MMPTTDNPPVITTDLSEEQVIAYMRCHPDLLFRYPDLIVIPSSQWQTGNVIDLPSYIITRLREEIKTLRGCTNELLQTAHSNMSTQGQTHQAVLALISTNSLESLCRTVTEDIPTLFNIDIAMLCVEPGLSLSGTLLTQLASGDVDRLLGECETLLQNEKNDGDPTLFKNAANAVNSSALARLHLGANLPHGLLALGAHCTDTFHATQGTELLTFLARILEHCLRRWLTTRHLESLETLPAAL